MLINFNNFENFINKNKLFFTINLKNNLYIYIMIYHQIYIILYIKTRTE